MQSAIWKEHYEMFQYQCSLLLYRHPKKLLLIFLYIAQIFPKVCTMRFLILQNHQQHCKIEEIQSPYEPKNPCVSMGDHMLLCLLWCLHEPYLQEILELDL